MDTTQMLGPSAPEQQEHDAILHSLLALGQHTDDLAVTMQHHQNVTNQALLAITDCLQQLSSAPSGAPAPPPASTVTPHPDPVPSRSVCFCEPHIFTRSAVEVEPFLQEITTAIHLQCCSLPTDYNKVIFLSTYLKDSSPSSWYYALEQVDPDILFHWDDFTTNFHNHFGDPDLVTLHLCKLCALKQTGSTANYSSKFHELLIHLDLSELMKIKYFHDGLKEEVKDLLITIKHSKSFDCFVSQVIVLDNWLHQHALECKSTKSSSHSDFLFHMDPHPHPSAPDPPAPCPSQPSSLNNVVLMEIDAAHQGPVSLAEKEHCWKEGLCFYCGKGKHWALDCPNMSEHAKKALQACQASSPPEKRS
jgi:hypothetical protein